MDYDRLWTPPQHRVTADTAGKWVDRVNAPGHTPGRAEALDDFGNSLIGKWLPGDLTPDKWERIKQATLAGELGVAAKVLEDWTVACVYTRDYRDLADLRRVMEQLRRLGCRGLINYKRDAETRRGIYGLGSSYWYCPAGTVQVLEPRVCRGREEDKAHAVEAEA